jgi:ABC-2 type transport system permease protein
VSYLRLFFTSVRINLMGELAYRVNFSAQLLQSFIELTTALLGVRLIFSYTDNLSGWTADEMLALVGIYMMTGGAISLIIEPSLEQFISSVRDGTLDFSLIKPHDAQFLISFQRFNVWRLFDVVIGAGVLMIALLRLGRTLGPWQALSFCLMSLLGLVMIYGFWWMLASLSFWLVRVENILVIFQSLYEAGRWPLSLYPGWMRFALTFLVPVAFATTMPAEALTGRLTVPALVMSMAACTSVAILSRVLWRLGLRRYSGASA